MCVKIVCVECVCVCVKIVCVECLCVCVCVCEWACFDWASEDKAQVLLNKAIVMARDARRSNNMSLAFDFVTNQNKDTTGQLIAQSSNSEGYTPDINDLWEANER